MFFEVNITPKENAAPVHADLGVLKFNLLLAPFQPQTRIKVETPLNTTACCYLCVRNPSSRPLNLQVTKQPPAERLVALNLSHLKIEPKQEVELVITWIAKQPGTFRDIIQLTDSRHIKYDIAITTSTISPKRNRCGSKMTENKKHIGDPKKKVLTENIRPEKKPPEAKRILSLTENFDSPTKKHKSLFSLNYQGKENISVNSAVDWQTPKKSSLSILSHRQEKSADISAGKLLDFSMLIESDTFALTPPPWFRNDPTKTANSSSDNFQFTTQSYTALLSPSKAESQELRRATYTTAPACKHITFATEDTRDGFTPAPRALDIPENYLEDDKLLNAQFAIPISTGNDTFEIVKSSKITESSPHSESLTALIETHHLVPTRLSKNFSTLSPVMPVIETRVNEYAISSSPICQSELKELSANSSSRYGFDGFNSFSKQFGVASVQEVLEADQWAKPTNQYSCTVVKNGSLSLESIQEETAKSTRATNQTYVKSLDLTQSINDSSTSASFRSEFSPPRHNHSKKTSPRRKISPKKFSKVHKDKSAQEISHLKKKATMNTPMKTGGKVSIPGVRITKLSLAGVARPKKSNAGSSRGFEHEVSMKLHDPDDFFRRLCNPDPFAATTTEDPFLASTLYYDDMWMKNQELEFKKWLNALLTPPQHLTSDVDTPLVDVAKVWQSCRLKEDVSLAETKEAVSARYHTNQRLNTLRRAACTMLCSNEVVSVLSQITVCVEKGNLVIRQDRNLHKDIGLQKLVLELLLCYNTLWLRIGLEAIYGETIPLNSNNDIIHLSQFLLSRFFSDPYIVKTHSHRTVLNLRLPTFFTAMNKFMLKKFLFLIYFLDYAKTRKLIGHDPCLFHKQSAHKESRRILLKFSQELLSGVGDVTKLLKPYGYILIHKQTELDEYSYAVDNLSHDLRDGVRLCRVMELITGKRNLTAICRVPAISRLQKVHNVDVALKALTTSGYTICGNITAKCIADGHREKTLSLLWQIIYKFQAPYFSKAARIIQKWWKSKLWWVRVKNFLIKRKRDAASVIQRAWRAYLAKKQLKSLKEQRARILATRHQAAKVIQSKWKATVLGLRDRRNFLRSKSASIIIQKAWRNYRAIKLYVRIFNRQKAASRIIQQHWRATMSMRVQLSAYLSIRNAAIKIQVWWKLKLAQKTAQNRYLAVKRATTLVQSKWRGNRLMRVQRNEYLKKVNAVRVIQEWWRRELTCRRDCNNFLLRKDAVRTIEKWWMCRSSERKLLSKEINAATNIQRKWRAIQVGRRQRQAYVELRTSVVIIQTKWRANKLARSVQKSYVSKRNAAIVIQSFWRNWRVGYQRRCAFVSLKAAAVCMQDRFRANKAARQASKDFNKMKQSVIILQRRWRAVQVGRQTRQEYMKKLSAAIVIQRKYKTIITARRYQSEKEAVIKIQLWWRACLLARETKSHYDLLKSTTIFLQRKYRAQKLSFLAREQFVMLKTSAIYIQRKWLAKKLTKLHREAFLSKRQAAIKMQSWWKACLIARETKAYYDTYRSTAICVQRKYRAKKLGNSVRQEFMNLRNAIVCVQRKWRANKCREDFLAKRRAVIEIQCWWRAVIAGRTCREIYRSQKIAAIKIQKWYRATVEARIMREKYNKYNNSITLIQNWWRDILSNRQRIKVRKASAATIIQAMWRGHKIRRMQSVEMTALRERSKKAATEAQPTATLAYRLEVAILIVQEYRDLGKLSQGLTALDTITHLLPQGCVALCEADFVGKLYDFLHRANRSRPWMDICFRVSSILVSIAKYPPTKSHVWRREYLDVIIRLLSSTVDREIRLFLTLATLLWLLADTPDRIQAIAESPLTVRSLTVLYHTVSKQKKRAAPLDAHLRPAKCILPNQKPDWGLRHNRPRLFTSVHHAVASLCKRLKIKVTE